VEPHAPLPSLDTGAVIGGRYRLERRVASGGMASVWEAHDDVLARKVAVKVLHPHLGADEQFVARFRREAVAAARLAHPSIVAIYDTCSEGGTEAIVMELVRGTTLRTELDRRGRFAPADAAHVVAEVADALAAAHAAGIVHRDVKPANVLLSADGRALVADFGIAKAADGLDLTGTDTTLGTAKYLAPEQVDPSLGALDARADVYAAGVILYELLTGTPPFVADTEAGTAFARLHRDPTRPSEAVPDLDPALEAVVLRAMARRPEARFADAAELRDALRDAARGVAPPPGPPTAPTPPVDPTGVVHVDGTAVVPRPGPGPAAPPAPARRPARRRWGSIVLASVVVMALAVVAVLAASTDDGDPPASGAATTPAAEGGGLDVAGVTTFDPAGDGEENESDAGATVDGNPETTWRTDCYRTNAFGNLKDGVGLVVQLATAGTLQELRVDSPGTGWTAVAYVAPSPSSDLAGWGDPVTFATAESPSTAFDLGGVEGGAVLLWFTDLGPAAGVCSGQNAHAVAVTELSVV